MQLGIVNKGVLLIYYAIKLLSKYCKSIYLLCFPVNFIISLLLSNLFLNRYFKSNVVL